ncbi:hypothetical protein RHM58_14800 [Pseudomonas sp. 10S4]|uniref:hypothetical protein n=1 Tax=Pseudomonas sp. 10S4 TaxID=3048583 RepID=UPI002AC9361F|nr:hypothetical protein [Pseudomonas sp. 10S4]WPX21014.1 hypothetical protein RHM58_14800 [Pseudomonas sp. 10S4]
MNSSGDLASQHRDRGYLFSDPRSTLIPSLNKCRYYSVVMVKDNGVTWLAKKLGVTITNKDAAA